MMLLDASSAALYMTNANRLLSFALAHSAASALGQLPRLRRRLLSYLRSRLQSESGFSSLPAQLRRLSGKQYHYQPSCAAGLKAVAAVPGCGPMTLLIELLLLLLLPTVTAYICTCEGVICIFPTGDAVRILSYFRRQRALLASTAIMLLLLLTIYLLPESSKLHLFQSPLISL